MNSKRETVIKKALKRKIVKIGIVIFLFIFIIVSVTITIATSTDSFFGTNIIDENLSEQENDELLQELKDKVEAANNKNTFDENGNQIGKLNDYYGVDSQFKLTWEYVQAYMKYMQIQDDKSTSDTDRDINYVRSKMDKAIDDLKPKFIYKKDKIVTVREYKVKEKSFSSSTGKDSASNVNTIATKPQQFDANNFKPGDKIYVSDENKTYTVQENEVTKTETKTENAYFLISVTNLIGSYSLQYTSETTTTQSKDEKITVTKPVLKAITPNSQNYAGLKAIIEKLYPDEQSDEAVNAIVTAAKSYIGEEIDSDDIFITGGGTFTGTGEVFTGSQKEFIEKVGKIAQAEYEKYNILPSITIAQAILESGWGKSKLTKVANNLFGIKAFSGWKGQYVEMVTKEEDASGAASYPVCKFRAYSSWEESIEDHSRVLLQPNFNGVRSATNYEQAAYALKAGGYATDVNYAQEVISYIRQYGLYQYDKK